MKTFSECEINTLYYKIRMMMFDEKIHINLFNQYAYCYGMRYHMITQEITRCGENYEAFLPYFMKKIIPIYIKEHGL